MKSEEILKADMLDLIFDGRNKEYGAYDLRRRYPNAVAKALLVGVLIALAVLSYSILRDRFADLMASDTDVEVNLTDLEAPPPMKENEPPPPPPPEPPPPPVRASVQYVPPVIKEVVAEEIAMATKKELEELDPAGETVKGDPNAKVEIDIKSDAIGLVEQKEKVVAVKVEDDNKVFTVVEQQPEFPGGQGAMYKWIGENLKYPSEARNNGLQGKVIMQFTVEKDGSISSVRVVRDAVGGGAGDEANRVVKKMPTWKPGRQNGKSVRVQYTLPVTFKLEE